MDQKTTLVDVIKLIYKRRKEIIIATLTVSVITAIIMLLMPNYYKATTTFYAASPDLAKPDPIGNNIIPKKYYGDKKDIDRILTISNASYIKSSLINEFNLYKHYDIDSSKEFAEFKIMKKISKLFTIKKNERDAIELSVEDKDQELVSKIANFARNKINTEIESLIKTTQKSQINTYNSKIKYKNTQVNSLIDSIRILKNKYSIFDINTQGEGIAEQVTQTKGNIAFLKSKLKILEKDRFARKDSIRFLKANIAGNESKLKNIDSLAMIFNEGSLTVSLLSRQKNQYSAQLALDNEKLNQLKSVYNSKITIMHIVEKAKRPLRKYRPVRSLYVIGAFILTLLFSIFMVVILEESKKINWN